MTGRDALVGFTGLVGGNLAARREFAVRVNSKNTDELRGGVFDHVLFSAARAEKWRANADPASDAAHVDELIGLLGSFTADRVTLVSTVDVYGTPRGVDEDSPIEVDGLHAYGANRRRLEQAVADLHARSLVVRLPALFGPGLKKNVVYDLLHDNQVDRIQPASSFQYYDLTRLADDLDVLWRADVRTANLVTEPVTTAAIVEQAFRRAPLPPSDALPVVGYDVRTRHGGLFGAAGPYIEERAAVLSRLTAFVAGVAA